MHDRNLFAFNEFSTSQFQLLETRFFEENFIIEMLQFHTTNAITLDPSFILRI